MTDKTLSLISLCRKAGRLRIGFDPVTEAVCAGEVCLVLTASDFSEGSARRLDRRLSDAGFPPGDKLALSATMEQLAAVCGKTAGVLAVADSGFAAGIRKLICAENKEE